MQVGIDSFAAAHDDASLSIDPSECLLNLIKQIELADQIGLECLESGNIIVKSSLIPHLLS